MRKAAQGPVGKSIMTIVMGLIIVSFVIWGVGDMLRGFTSIDVASVGPTTITRSNTPMSLSAMLQHFQRQLRQPLTSDRPARSGSIAKCCNGS